MTIGERIKLRRKQLGLSQNDLADLVKTSQQQIGRYEKDENSPTADYIVAMATALETTSDWLLGLSEDVIPHYDETHLGYDEQRLLRIYRTKPRDKQESILAMAQVI